MKTPIAALAFLLLLLTCSVSFAQPDHRKGPSQERLELIKLWRLVDELEITEEQAVKLFPVLSAHRRARRDLLEKSKTVGAELENLLGNESALDADLHNKMDALRAVERQESELKMTFHKKLEGLLSARQQAQFLLFEGRFRGDLRGIVRQFRELEGGGPSPYRRGRGSNRRLPEGMH